MALRLLCNEHVGSPLLNMLETSYHVERVVTVEELGSGADNVDVWQYATQNRLLVFSNDTDFVDGTAKPDNSSHPGVIRYIGIDWPAIYRATQVIEQHLSMDELAGNTFRVPGI